MTTVYGSHLTAQDAAETFARTAWEQPRKVDPRSWSRGPTDKLDEFALVGGTRRYSITCNESYTGWDIQPIGGTL